MPPTLCAGLTGAETTVVETPEPNSRSLPEKPSASAASSNNANTVPPEPLTLSCGAPQDRAASCNDFTSGATRNTAASRSLNTTSPNSLAEVAAAARW